MLNSGAIRDRDCRFSLHPARRDRQHKFKDEDRLKTALRVGPLGNERKLLPILSSLLMLTLVGCAPISRTVLDPQAENGEIIFGQAWTPPGTARISFNRENVKLWLAAVMPEEDKFSVWFWLEEVPENVNITFTRNSFLISGGSENKPLVPDDVKGFKDSARRRNFEGTSIDWHSLNGNKYRYFIMLFSFKLSGITHFVFQVPPMQINDKSVTLPPVTFTRRKEWTLVPINS